MSTTQDLQNFSRLDSAWILPRPWQHPAEWAAKNLDLSPLSGIACDFWNPQEYPYTVDVLNSFDFRGQRKTVTVMAPEQTGKTIVWIAGFLWLLKAIPSPGLIIYPDDELCRRINQGKVIPLMRKIPELAAEMEITGSVQRDHYAFSDSTTYYSGSGSPITSLSCSVIIADELDTWIKYEGKEHPLSGAKKRARSFENSLIVEVCTPKGRESESDIYSEFRESSQNFYHLRCAGCGELTMRSCDIHNLQWELDGDDQIIPDSIRLICPKCKREHTEGEKGKMIRCGGYVPLHPERSSYHEGFQWGALVSTKPALSWAEIAKAQLKAGDSGALADKLDFYNSIRGLPMRPGTVAGRRESKLLARCVPAPDPADVFQIWMSADTQDDCFFYVVRAVDRKLNTYLIDCGRALTLEELASVADRNGIHYGIIDTGGHRTREIYSFIATHKGWLGYKGNSHIGKNWKVSEESSRLLLADPKFYKSDLLGQIYQPGKERKMQWYISLPEIPDDYRDQILDMAPNRKVRNGNSFEKYESSGNDHFFDAEKMLLVLRDYWVEKILPGMVKRQQEKHK